jgi:hypothetical protein
MSVYPVKADKLMALGVFFFLMAVFRLDKLKSGCLYKYKKIRGDEKRWRR